MTALAAPLAAGPELLVHLVRSRGAERVHDLARRAGLTCTLGPADAARPGPEPRTVTIVVAEDAEEALCDGRDFGPCVVVCDTVTRAGVRLALRAGAAVLRTADLTAENLAKAVRSAGNRQPGIPYPVLSHLLAAGPPRGRPAPDVSTLPLTARQTTVLRLMADGHGNADISRMLSCSEHTVKNVIYEVMARLQARNRAHAVAHAVRSGLI